MFLRLHPIVCPAQESRRVLRSPPPLADPAPTQVHGAIAPRHVIYAGAERGAVVVDFDTCGRRLLGGCGGRQTDRQTERERD